METRKPNQFVNMWRESAGAPVSCLASSVLWLLMQRGFSATASHGWFCSVASRQLHHSVLVLVSRSQPVFFWDILKAHF
ncbi:hypothetical protein SDJN02_21257, partial [Cucurbita argyrosperma subsp. argyrosperma]